MRTRFWSFSEALLLLGAITAILSVSTCVDASPFLILDLGTLGGTNSVNIQYGGAVNNAGQVVGTSTSSGGTLHPFRTLPNTPISLSSDFEIATQTDPGH